MRLLVRDFIISPPLWFVLLAYSPLAIMLHDGWILFLLGIAAWSLWEYANHRWVLHRMITTHHRVHHIDKSRCVSLPLFLSVTVILILTLTAPSGGVSGFAAGYAIYECAHALSPSWHDKHHVDRDVFFGVSTPIWDYLLGTAQ